MPNMTPKQDRQAEHIEESEEARGMDPKAAKSVGFATINKQKSKSKKIGNKARPRWAT